MPTYEYVCKQCGQQFEVVQSFSAKPLRRHEACGGELKKVFHARGIVFKGSGFYHTDSRRKASTAASSDSKPDSKPSETKKAESSAGTAAD